MKIKKLGIGNALEKTNPGLFAGGEAEILDRVEITGFETVKNSDGSTTVVTKYKINKIPASTSTVSSGSGSTSATQTLA